MTRHECTLTNYHVILRYMSTKFQHRCLWHFCSKLTAEWLIEFASFIQFFYSNLPTLRLPTSAGPVISFVFITSNTIPCNCLLELHLSSPHDKSIVCTLCIILISQIENFSARNCFLLTKYTELPFSFGQTSPYRPAFSFVTTQVKADNLEGV